MTDPLEDPMVFGRMLARRHAEQQEDVLDVLIENTGEGSDLLMAGAQLQQMFPIDPANAGPTSVLFWMAAESFLEYRAEIKHQQLSNWADI